ncbi:MAG: gephyrin-like molybdotransferase Glp [Bacteroidales bacterium]
MIPFNEALSRVLSIRMEVPTEKVSLREVSGRVLAEDVISDLDMPPFNKSAMDGYACRREDLTLDLAVTGEIAAGGIPPGSIGEGECMKIMTGAMIPAGADYVLVKEEAQQVTPGVVKAVNPSKSSNICLIGEDCRKGDLLISHGTLIKAQHVAVMAAAGYSMIEVFRRPTVLVISTGNELVEADKIPSQVQIRNSNGPQVLSQLSFMGISADYAGIIRDNAQQLYVHLRNAFEKYQLVLVSGGVSVGDYDFIPQVLTDMGVDILFHGMKARPGKHMLFGRKGDHFIFGLPGNPVSSFVQFELLVRPFIGLLEGREPADQRISLPLASDYTRKKTGTKFFIPAYINPQGSVEPLEYHGSAHIHAYLGANAMMEIEEDRQEIKSGERVYVRPI